MHNAYVLCGQDYCVNQEIHGNKESSFFTSLAPDFKTARNIRLNLKKKWLENYSTSDYSIQLFILFLCLLYRYRCTVNRETQP